MLPSRFSDWLAQLNSFITPTGTSHTRSIHCHWLVHRNRYDPSQSIDSIHHTNPIQRNQSIDRNWSIATDRSQPTNPSQSIRTISIDRIIEIDSIREIRQIAIDRIIAIDSIHRNQSIDRDRPIAIVQSISIHSNHRNRSNHPNLFDPIDLPNRNRSLHQLISFLWNHPSINHYFWRTWPLDVSQSSNRQIPHDDRRQTTQFLH